MQGGERADGAKYPPELGWLPPNVTSDAARSPPTAPARGRRPGARRRRRLPLGLEEVPERRHGARGRHVRDPPGRVRLPRRLDRLGQVDDHAAADQGDRAELRLDRGRRPRPLRDHAQEDPVLPPQPRRRLPGLQAAAQPDGLRQRRLRAPGDGRHAPRGAREGARHPAPHRPLDQAAQLPRPALGRRAAARLGGARVRQPPAAAAGRRADRQPRSRDVGRDHAAALPDQPHRHDRGRRDARQGDGRPHAPARDRGLAGPRRARRAHRRLQRAARTRASSARSGARGSSEVRLLPARGAARAAAQRRAVVRGDRDGARHGARARRLHPGRAGHDRRGERDPRQGARRRLPQDRRHRGRHQPRAAHHRGRDAGRRQASSSSPSRRRSAPSAKPAAAPTTTCSAPTRCPTCCASRPTARRTSCRCATRSRRCRRRASAP